MAIPRKNQICLKTTPYYHVTNTCARQSPLTGYDFKTKKDYSHRKKFIEERIHFLSEFFAIDIIAYSIMSNHYHIGLHINQKKAENFSDEEVIYRWCKVSPSCEKKVTNAQQLGDKTLKNLINRWRNNLFDLGWFMKKLNESVARMANKEDNCKGAFWAGRYYSKAILSIEALLNVMVYIDLNPLRANIAKTPEQSKYTSIYQRIKFLRNNLKSKFNLQSKNFNLNKLGDICNQAPQIESLVKFSNHDISLQDDNDIFIDYTFKEYLELLDYSARVVKPDKKGYLSENVPHILKRLKINHNKWPKMINGVESNFSYAIGSPKDLKKFMPTFKFRGKKKLSNVAEYFL